MADTELLEAALRAAQGTTRVAQDAWDVAWETKREAAQIAARVARVEQEAWAALEAAREAERVVLFAYSKAARQGKL